MRVIVIGGGIIGASSAWALAGEGHDVTLLEREAGLGLGASFANAGQLSPTMAAPWAVPGLLRKALGWMFQEHPPLRVSRLDLPSALWLWRMFRAATPQRFLAAKRAMVELSMLSQQKMHDAEAQGLTYSRGGTGTLVLLRNEAMRHAMHADTAVLDQMELPYRWMSADEVREREPNFNRVLTIDSGLLLTADATGDCQAATISFQSMAEALGARIVAGCEVRSFIRQGDRLRAVKTADGDIEADLFVLSAGSWSNRLLGSLGLSVPVIPLKGYSLTIDADPEETGPVSTISDDYFKVGVTNLGDRIRVGGTAELAGFDLGRPEKRYAALNHVAGQLFPKIPPAAIASAARWSGLRPTTPDGPPILSRVNGIGNLILNLGHGTLGWTMAAGSASIVADLVADRQPDIPISAFSLDRHQ